MKRTIAQRLARTRKTQTINISRSLLSNSKSINCYYNFNRSYSSSELNNLNNVKSSNELNNQNNNDDDQHQLVTVDTTVPNVFKVMGGASLVPMITSAALVLYFTSVPYLAGQVIFIQMSYAATLLVFSGATHYGFAIANYHIQGIPLLNTKPHEINSTPIPASTSTQQQQQQTIEHQEAKEGSEAEAVLEVKEVKNKTNQLNWYRAAFSFAPVLLTCAALASTPSLGMATLIAGFTGTFIGDCYASKSGLLPPWYLKYKLAWTAVIIPCLAVSFILFL